MRATAEPGPCRPGGELFARRLAPLARRWAPGTGAGPGGRAGGAPAPRVARRGGGGQARRLGDGAAGGNGGRGRGWEAPGGVAGPLLALDWAGLGQLGQMSSWTRQHVSRCRAARERAEGLVGCARGVGPIPVTGYTPPWALPGGVQGLGSCARSVAPGLPDLSKKNSWTLVRAWP